MKIHGPGWLGVPPGAAEFIRCKFFTMHKDLKISLFDDVTGDYLVDYWRILEVRKRYWSMRNPECNLVARHKLHNLQLIMQAIWRELERRADSLPINALLLLIETGNSFYINLNPKP